MKTMRQVLPLLLGAALLAAGCAGDPQDASLLPGNTTYTLADLQGSWQSACEYVGTEDRVVTMTFSASAVVRTETYWTGATACGGTPLRTETFSGTTRLVSDVTTAAGVASRVDFTITSPAMGVVKELVRVEGNQLYMGDSSAPTADGYPTEVDTASPLTRL